MRGRLGRASLRAAARTWVRPLACSIPLRDRRGGRLNDGEAVTGMQCGSDVEDSPHDGLSASQPMRAASFSVSEDVAQAQRVRHLQERRVVPRVGQHVLLPPAPRGLGMDVETPVYLAHGNFDSSLNRTRRSGKSLGKPGGVLLWCMRCLGMESPVLQNISRQRLSYRSVQTVRQPRRGRNGKLGAPAATGSPPPCTESPGPGEAMAPPGHTHL